MALNIKSASTEYKVRKLAQRTGQTLTQTVDAAVEQSLRLIEDAPEAGKRREAWEARLAAWRAKRAEYGPPATESWDWKKEIYDENGLSRW